MRKIQVTIKNIRGEYKPLNLFKFFDDGIRKRLPRNLANEFKSELLANIDSNRFNFQLSRQWLNYKKRVGADSRPFIMLGYYKKAITIVTNDGHLSVGFRSSSMHPRAKMSMGKLATKLEYGDVLANIPARPLWRRTAESFFKERKTNVGNLIASTLKERK